MIRNEETSDPVRWIILDRDGVLNEDSDSYIKSPEEWQPIPGSLEAIALLNRHGYKVVVITNQSGLGRGLYDLAVLEKIHDKMHRALAEKGGRIEAIYYCPHGPGNGCRCRKPEPGLLEQFASEKAISLENVPFVGDTLRDIQAGRKAGARPILVRTGKGLKTLAENPDLDIPIYENLYEAAEHIILGR